MTDLAEIILRLGGATLVGAAIGLNRDLRGQPIGVRTLGLVGLASAMAPVAVVSYGGAAVHSVDAASRVIQGVLTGIGFLCAGVIVRRNIGERVHGLTTAACGWTTASLGLVCGLAAWPIVGVGVVLVFMLLIFGGPLEHMFHGWLSPHTDAPARGETTTSPKMSPK